MWVSNINGYPLHDMYFRRSDGSIYEGYYKIMQGYQSLGQGALYPFAKYGFRLKQDLAALLAQGLFGGNYSRIKGLQLSNELPSDSRTIVSLNEEGYGENTIAGYIDDDGETVNIWSAGDIYMPEHSGYHMFGDLMYIDDDDINNIFPHLIHHSYEDHNYNYFAQSTQIRNPYYLSNLKVNSARQMFDSCSNLSDLSVCSTWDVSDCEDCRRMFYGCRSLVYADLGAWNFKPQNSSAINIMFGNCRNLLRLDMSGWDLSEMTGQIYPIFSSYYPQTIIAPKVIGTGNIQIGRGFPTASSYVAYRVSGDPTLELHTSLDRVPPLSTLIRYTHNDLINE